MARILCPHACAAIKLLHGNVYSYVEECYLKSSQEKIYMNTMVPMETHDMTDVNNLSIASWVYNVFLMPPIITHPHGEALQEVCQESQSQDLGVYRCCRCHQSDHNRAKCRNPNLEVI